MALRDLDPDAHLRDPSRKQRYVTTLFDTIAPRYDRFTTLFSFGMDASWKRRMGRWVAEVVGPGDLVLDLACGTGDLVETVGRFAGGGRQPRLLVGLDPSAEMLDIARARLVPARPDASRAPLPATPAGPAVRLIRGDLMALPLAGGIAGAVTVGYGFRNTPDAAAALREVGRVLRPGGWLFTLDFFQPERVAWRRLYLRYLRVTGRAVGRWWHHDPEAYGYIARSLELWMTPTRFAEVLGAAGFEVRRKVSRLGGGICLHAARRLP